MALLDGITPLDLIASGRLPEFVQFDHPRFKQFVAAYYSWMKENGQPFAAIDNLKNYTDIDQTIDDFVSYFLDTFAQSLPRTIIADKRLVTKHVRDMYLAKGSESSYKLLFRILFNEDVEFYYPKVDILIASDGKWETKTTIRVATTDNQIFKLQSQRITGLTSGATAIVDNIEKYQIGAYQQAELNLSLLNGVFVPNETVRCITQDDEIVDHTTGYVMSGITITNRGTGYASGDVITITGGSGVDAAAEVDQVTVGSIDTITINDGGADYVVGDQLIFSSVEGATTARAIVSAVDVSGAITSITLLSGGYNYKTVPTITVDSDAGTGADIEVSGAYIGGIKTINITSFGLGYSSAPTVSFSSIGNGDATGTAVVGAMCFHKGHFVGYDGFLSDIKVLQDSKYYQNFSYQLKSGTSISFYRDIVRRVLHPAGMELFGSVLVVRQLDVEAYFQLLASGNAAILTPKLSLNGNVQVIIPEASVEEPYVLNHCGMTYAQFDLWKERLGDADFGYVYDSLVFESFEVDPDHKRFPYTIGTWITTS